MVSFDFRFVVPASLRDVRAFHADTRALKILTPPPVFVQIHEVEPLAEGSMSRFTFWVGPLPLHWTARHRDVSREGFTDVQTAGPARAWSHTHRFIKLSPDRTEIVEHIEFEHYAGRRGWITRMLFCPANLWAMFQYRRWVTCRSLRRRKS